LIYALNPRKAAQMPAHWAAIPTEVVEALNATVGTDKEGQIPFADVQRYFR